jgi:hypothetical protein
MFLSPTQSTPAKACPCCATPEDVAALTIQRLAELDRLRDIGLKQAETLATLYPLLSPEQQFRRMAGNGGTVAGYERVVRAVRQITVPEFELRGLFHGPDRDAPRKRRLAKAERRIDQPVDLEARLNRILAGQESVFDIRGDYRTGPLDEVVAGIRATLGTAPPPNDPFAKTAGHKPPVIQAKAPALPVRPKIAARIRPSRRPDSAKPKYIHPESAQEEPAHKAAMLAIQSLGGKGFRIPAKSKKPSRGPPK